MSNVINLSKGEKMDLTKGTGITGLQVGLNWDAVGSGNGIMGKILGAARAAVQGDIDVDSSVFMLDDSGKNRELVSFQHLRSNCGSIQHMGDNRTGEDCGKGVDDETININLQKVPAHIHKLVVVANIYNCVAKNQHFGLIGNAVIKLRDQSGKPICEYNLTKDCAKSTAIIVGEIYRHSGEWKFNAIGQGTSDTCLGDMAKRY